MLQIAKQILCFVVCVAITCGCTTIRTRTLVNYIDDGSHRTPIVKYNSTETTYTIRQSLFREKVFPMWKEMITENPKVANDPFLAHLLGYFAAGCILIGIPIAIDVISIPVAAVMHTTETVVKHNTYLSLRGKLVNDNNQPLPQYTFKVSSYHGTSEVTTDRRGIFEIVLTKNTTSWDGNVTFRFPDKNVQSIIYMNPFEAGIRNTVFPLDYKVHQSNIPATGNVIVLDEKPAQPVTLIQGKEFKQWMQKSYNR